MGLFDIFKKKPPNAAAPAAAAPAVPRGIVVEGEDGAVDFGRLRPDDPNTFVTMLREWPRCSRMPDRSSRTTRRSSPIGRSRSRISTHLDAAFVLIERESSHELPTQEAALASAAKRVQEIVMDFSTCQSKYCQSKY